MFRKKGYDLKQKEFLGLFWMNQIVVSWINLKEHHVQYTSWKSKQDKQAHVKIE